MICKKMATIDTPLRLGDRLVDTAFGSLSASLYYTYTVRVTAMLGDMEDFFKYWVLQDEMMILGFQFF